MPSQFERFTGIKWKPSKLSSWNPSNLYNTNNEHLENTYNLNPMPLLATAAERASTMFTRKSTGPSVPADLNPALAADKELLLQYRRRFEESTDLNMKIYIKTLINEVDARIRATAPAAQRVFTRKSTGPSVQAELQTLFDLRSTYTEQLKDPSIDDTLRQKLNTEIMETNDKINEYSNLTNEFRLGGRRRTLRRRTRRRRS